MLIQGPPGTGKTRTILNLLSVVMHAAKKGSLELVRAAPGERASALDEEARAALWQAQAPWLFDVPNPRDLVPPEEVGTSADCFGLVAPQRTLTIGRTAGPKAHVLVCAPSNSALVRADLLAPA